MPLSNNDKIQINKEPSVLPLQEVSQIIACLMSPCRPTHWGFHLVEDKNGDKPRCKAFYL